jgi:adenylate cyclase
MADRSDAPHDRDDVERLVRLGPRELTWPEVCSRAGVEHEVADVLWRALGFPDVPPEERAYTDEDVRALAIAAEGIDLLQGDRREAAIEAIVREARMVSAHLTRVAEIEVDAMVEMRTLGLRERSLDGALQRGLEHSDMGWLLLYGLRRRLDEVLRRRLTVEAGGQPRLAVGFVDLVGFTRVSGSLRDDEFAALLSRFESLASDIVTEAGGRLVKLIGDEAMFVVPAAQGAARAALELVASCEANGLPEARAGLAVGPLLARGGDYFGRPVNLASRLAEDAPPGGVLADEQLADAIRQDSTFALQSKGRQPIRGLGDVDVWQLNPAPGPPPRTR